MAEVTFDLMDPGYWDYNSVYDGTPPRYSIVSGANADHDFEPGREQTYDEYAFWADYAAALIVSVRTITRNCWDGPGCITDDLSIELSGTGFDHNQYDKEILSVIDGEKIEHLVTFSAPVQLQQLGLVRIQLNDTSYYSADNGVYLIEFVLDVQNTCFWKPGVNLIEIGCDD